MKCPKCGQEAVGNFCSNCGTPLVNDTVRREQETVGRKQENSYDDGDSEQRNPARMESDEKKAESGSGSKRNSQEKRSSQSQDAQKREEERRDNERCQSQAQEDARRDREAASRRRQDARRSSSSAKEDKRDANQLKQMDKRLMFSMQVTEKIFCSLWKSLYGSQIDDLCGCRLDGWLLPRLTLQLSNISHSRSSQF